MKFTTTATLPADGEELLREHHRWSVSVTPPGHVHAINPGQGPKADAVWVQATDSGTLAAICALVPLNRADVELKAMHVRATYRKQGLGRRLLDYAVASARRRGHSSLVLETGTYDAFEPARKLYLDRGFVPRPPFGSYEASPVSVCMELDLTVPS